MPSHGSSLFVASLLGIAALRGQPAAPRAVDEKYATVQGEVRDSVTLAPIERAHVSVGRDRNGTWESYGALTAADGTFAITKINLPSDSEPFILRLERTGYVDLTLPSESRLTLQSGDRKTRLKLKLTPAGVITGRVFDSAGVPLEGATVSAIVGARTQRTSVTDDRGAYRLGGLTPGKYRVVAQLQSISTPPEIRTDGTSEVHHSPTYHPSELNLKNVVRLDVAPAAEISSVDIRLARTPILRVSGRVAGVPEGVQNTRVALNREGGEAANSDSVLADGSFVIWRVHPGRYTIRAQGFNGNEPLRSAPIQIDIAQTNIDGIELRLLQPVNIKGAIVDEDAEARKVSQLPSRRFANLRETLGSYSGVSSAPIEEDGAFLWKGISPGRYRVAMAPAHVYVRSMEFGQTHIEGAELDLSSGAAAPLILHLASATGVVTGVVRDGDAPAAGLSVMLDAIGSGQPGPMRSQSGPDGVFRISNVPPGKYRIVAIDEVDAQILNSGEDFEAAADILEVGDGQTITKDIKPYRTAHPAR
jgi:hypothetical protein